MAELKGRLSFVNPKFLENARLNYSNWNVPRVLKFYEVSGNDKTTLPRGFMRQLIGLCRQYNVNYGLQDSRRVLPEVSFSFRAELRPYQEDAVTAMLRRDFGVLSSPTGSGKTIMCLSMIAERRQPALICCHTRELQLQWIDRIETFLQIPANEIGVIGGGKKQIGEKVTVALIQSLYKCADEIKPSVGYLIVDECHKMPARCFREAVTTFDCKYMLGLSATAWRRDGLTRLIFWTLGDQVHKIERDDLVEKGHVLPFEVISRETNFQTSYNASEEYSRMLSELTMDNERNALIVRDVVAEANNGGGTCLVLSDRKAHCEAIQALLRGHGVKAELLTGDVSNKHREEIVKNLNAGKVKVLIATIQILSEGFDSKELSTLFLTTPIKFSGRLIQSVGRILRPAPGKKAKVFDYADILVPVLRASAKSRQRVCRGH